MGKLALWGAVAGGAKGYQKELANREKREATAIDEARQARFAKMKMEHDEALAARGEQHDKDMAGLKSDYTIKEIGARGESQQEVDQSRIGATTESQLEVLDARNEHDASEGALDRASREKIAELGRSKPTAAAIEAARRYKPGKTKTTRLNPDTGMEEIYEVPSLFDKESNLTYEQHGTDFYLPGAVPSREEIAARRAAEDQYASMSQQERATWNRNPENIRVASPENIQKLYDNPDRVAEFYDKFKFIPGRLMQVLSARP